MHMAFTECILMQLFVFSLFAGEWVPISPEKSYQNNRWSSSEFSFSHCFSGAGHF